MCQQWTLAKQGREFEVPNEENQQESGTLMILANNRENR